MTNDKFNAGTLHEVAVTHHFTTILDPDEVEAWIEANLSEGRAQVRDLETGEMIHDGF